MQVHMEKLGKTLLAPLVAFALLNGGAVADDEHKRDYGHRKDRCEILTAEVTADNQLVITGGGLTKGTRLPEVWFGGASVEVLTDPAPAPTQIIADLGDIVDALDGPKDFLLEIKRSRRDRACPSHLVTVVPAGDDIKTVFVTSGVYDGAFTQAPDVCLGVEGVEGIERGDCICNVHALVAGLQGPFVAWLSDQSTDAKDRLPLVGPWYNLNPDGRQLVAETLIDLITCEGTPPSDECIENPITFDEKGQDRHSRVWTGTLPDGTALSANNRSRGHCASWVSNADFAVDGRFGGSDHSKSNWTAFDTFRACSALERIYCFQR